MKVTCTKIEAGVRQLDEAIALLFTEHDPLAVHTLAAAARGIFTDLIERARLGTSSRAMLIDAMTETRGLSRKTALEVLHRTQNYLKHAERDPDEMLSFTEEATDHLIFGCIWDCMKLDRPVSYRMEAFRLWYFACYPDMFDDGTEEVRVLLLSYPDMHTKTREEKMAWGAEIVQRLSPR